MPRDPGEAFTANVDIDDEKRHRLKLRDVVEVESQFKDRRKDAVFMSWRFSVHDLDSGVAAIDNNTGDIFELWVPTNDATFRNRETGKIGGARDMAETLVGRELSDDEIMAMNAGGIEGWQQELIGKTLLADVEWTQTEQGYPRLKLLRKRTDSKARVAAPPPRQEAPAAEPASNGAAREETREERRERLKRELEEVDA
jgi:hypothetical protein